MNRLAASGLACASFLSLVAGVRADVVQLTPVKDNTLYQPDPGNPPTERSNGAGPQLFSGRIGGLGGGFGLRRGLMAFDVAGNVPPGSSINSATLTVYCDNHPLGDAGVARLHVLHRMVADWGEGADFAAPPGGNGAAASNGSATWSSRFLGLATWTFAGGDFVAPVSSTVPVTNSGAPYTFPTTAQLVFDVQLMLDSPGSDFGWVLCGDEINPGSARAFDSREGTNPPVLTIDFTPDAAYTLCAGDGSYPSNAPGICPCGNTSAVGAGEGCVNSSMTHGGTLRPAGGSSFSLATDGLRLDATHPAGNSGLLLLNTSIFATGVATAGFDGMACVGGGPRALPGADNGLTQPFGDVDLAGFDGVRNLGGTAPGTGLYGLVNATFPGFFVTGATYYAQFWHRDVLCGPPPATCNTPCTTPPPGAANFTNAVRWTVTP